MVHVATLLWILVTFAGAALGCARHAPATRAAPDFAPPSEADDLARRIEQAHGLNRWTSIRAVAADLVMRFGEEVALDGRMIYDPHGGRARMELERGAVLVFDGATAWVWPESAQVPMARFHLLTWPYFLAAPFKLRDPGTKLAPYGARLLRGLEHPAALLTFQPGTGDSPEDWYVVYEDPATHRLAAMAYIVTYGGKAVEEAEKEPHAIVYHDYELIGGVLLSSRWTFHHWSAAEGPHGPPIGEARIGDLRFVEPRKDDFSPPQGAREAPLP